jgi:hypothetical protein
MIGSFPWNLILSAIITPHATSIRKIRAMAVMIQTLASLSSAPATDASAFDASISALKSSISALESSIDSLDGASAFWERVGWSCAIAVGLGVIAEVVTIVREYLEDRHIWRRGIVRPPDCPSFRWMLFDVFATVVVVAGIFGEAGATGKVSSINSKLRSKTSELRAKSDQLLALVTLEAGSAASSALRAHDSAEIAREDAAKLQLEVLKQGPRSTLLRGHRNDLIKKLRPFAGQRFTTLECFESNDLEPNMVAIEITGILESGARWTNNGNNGNAPGAIYGGQHITDTEIIVRILPTATEATRRSAKSLFSALSDALLTGVKFADNGQGIRQILQPMIPFDEQTVLIEVGVHPEPLTPPH